MTALHVRVTFDLAYQCYLTETGRDKRDIGPKWSTPKEAAQYARLLDQPRVDPRRSGETSTREPSAPLPASGLLDVSPEPLGSASPTRSRP